MDELTRLVSDIEVELKDKKAKLAPQIKQLRAYRQKYQEMEQIYNEKKKAYDNTVMNLESEKSKLNEELDKAWGEYKSDETKFHYQNIQTKIYEALNKKITQDKPLDSEFQSFDQFYRMKLKNQEHLLVDLKKHQRYVKDNYENNSL